MTPPHIITSTLGEQLKYALVPSGLYMRYRAAKERRHGEPEVHLLRYLIDPKKDAIDAGAGKGVYTYLMARLARHVYAFEPNPKMHHLGKLSPVRFLVTAPSYRGDGGGGVVAAPAMAPRAPPTAAPAAAPVPPATTAPKAAPLPAPISAPVSAREPGS